MWPGLWFSQVRLVWSTLVVVPQLQQYDKTVEVGRFFLGLLVLLLPPLEVCCVVVLFIAPISALMSAVCFSFVSSVAFVIAEMRSLTVDAEVSSVASSVVSHGENVCAAVALLANFVCVYMFLSSLYYSASVKCVMKANPVFSGAGFINHSLHASGNSSVSSMI